ncbi:uncharacterized protein PRCAT00005574001 [Priceomyces carsonii]|uniref:uncharacterized protein n=1 Tax=Priceomyces carsonii TaxID=28549 RepID=UPI002EDB728A|nr:unnamed protein product [Priceomyces carsonii]
MGPKKKLGLGKEATRGKSKSKGPNEQSWSQGTGLSYTSSQMARYKGQNGNGTESHSQPNQIFLSRKNKLNDYLTSNDPTQNASTSKKTKQTSRKNSGSFEEDDGFIYKRSQSTEGHFESDRKRKAVSTPITQLEQEISNISKDDDEVELDDLRIEKESSASIARNAFHTLRPSPKRSLKTSTRSNAINDSSLQLSSPIGRRSVYEDQGFSSDEYVEQVSHHKISLTDQPTANPKSSKVSKGKKTTKPTKRRTSYYNRGKRVLSIGNGFQGEIHDDVPVSDYYKRLDNSLPEPDKMRQLLIWCFKKKLSREEKLTKLQTSSSEEQTVVNIAKVIKEEIIKALMEKEISTSWYSSSDSQSNNDILTSKEITVPNPQNITNLENIGIYRLRLSNLIKEKEEWQGAFKQAVSPIERLSINSMGEDELTLSSYLVEKAKNGRIDFSSTVINNSLIKKIDENCETASKQASQLESSIDNLHATSYQLKQLSDLVASIQDKDLNAKASALLKEYVTKNSFENYKRLHESDTKMSSSTWPYPKKSVSTIDLLKGITRLDALM